AGTGDDLTLYQPGESFAHGRGDAAAEAAVVVRGDPVRVRVEVSVQVDGDEQVGAKVVGELGAVPAGDRVGGVRPSGQVDPHTGRREPAFESQRNVERQVGFGPAQRPVGHDNTGIVGSAVSGVDHDPLADQRRTRGVECGGLPEELWAPA